MSSINRRTFLAAGAAAAGYAAAHDPETPVPAESSRDRSPSAPLGMLVVAPSTVAVGQPFMVRLKILTTPYRLPLNCFTEHYPTLSSSTGLSPRGIRYMDNVVPQWSGRLEVSVDNGSADGPSEIVIDGQPVLYPHDSRPFAHAGPFVSSEPCTLFVRVTDPDSGVSQVSNPIQVSGNDLAHQLFWGDIHGHTMLTDGIRSPEEVYYFARDEAFLDVCAITEHAEFFVTPGQWSYLKESANSFNEHDRFVTLVAQEWTHRELGHRNIYHRGNDAPIIRATDPDWNRLEALHRFAREHRALVVPHHPASDLMGVDWTQGYDPEVERLVEIYSTWGNSERAEAEGNTRPIHSELGGERAGQHVVDALRLGRKFGIIASGDYHDGRPGDVLAMHQDEPANYRYSQRNGLVGIWAPQLTRDAVFDALWNRRVYGTTGPRIILSWTMDGQPMGATIPKRHSAIGSISVSSEVPIARIDLVKDGNDIDSITPDSPTATWSPTISAPEDGAGYYVRVTRADNEMAWSSPIWVESA